MRKIHPWGPSSRLLFLLSPAFSQQAQRNPVGQTALRQIIPGHYVFSSGTFNRRGHRHKRRRDRARRPEFRGRRGGPNEMRLPITISATGSRFWSPRRSITTIPRATLAFADVWRIGHEKLPDRSPSVDANA